LCCWRSFSIGLRVNGLPQNEYDRGDLPGRLQGRPAQSPASMARTLLAGRCARAGPDMASSGCSTGGDRVSHAAVRNMMCCAVSGQGAGVAAAISLRTGEPFDRLDIEAVQTELRRQGARIQ